MAMRPTTISPPKLLSQITILLVGDPLTGKTSTVNRYCTNSFHEEKISHTDLDMKKKEIKFGESTLTLLIWDPPGHIRTFTTSYYRNCKIVIVIYAVNSLDSFNSVENWIEEAKKFALQGCEIVIAGNKIDLVDERKVTTEQGQSLASKHGLLFMEISAKLNQNIENLFFQSITTMKTNKRKTVSLSPKMSFQKPSSYKIIFLGVQNSGKTSIIQRFKTNKVVQTTTTIGVELETLSFPTCTLTVWDTAGHEFYESLTKQYYRDSKCCVLVFDVTSIKSFSKIQHYKDAFEQESNDEKSKQFFILIGNKIDLQDKRQVQDEQARNFLRSLTGGNNIHSKYFETSAFTGSGIREVFEYIAEVLPQIFPPQATQTKSILLHSESKKRFSIRNDLHGGGNCCAKAERTEIDLPSTLIENFDNTSEIYRQYLYPFHLSKFDAKKIVQIACDLSAVCLSEAGKVYTWGGLGANNDRNQILYADNSTFETLEEKIANISSSGMELTVYDEKGKIYLNTLWGAPRISFIPQKILALNTVDIAQIAIGENTSALCTKTGHLYTWGNGKEGSLGHGTRDNIRYPLKVLAFSRVELSVLKVACGDWHMLILVKDSTVWSCGSNSHGQLGTAMRDPSVSVPLQIPELKKIVDIGCGASYSLALNSDGELYSWGDVAVLGRRAQNLFTYVPSMITIVPKAKVTSFSAGPNHAACITSTNKLYTWGSNIFGQLGLQSNVEQFYEPSAVEFPIKNAAVLSVSCGLKHTACIVSKAGFIKSTKDGGFLYTFGRATKGQVGTGNYEEKITSPRKVDISGESEVKQVVCGRNHTLVLGETGKLYACGSNSKGQLGIDKFESKNQNGSPLFLPIDPENLGSEKIQSVFACHSYNVVITDKSVYAWGYHQFQMNVGVRQLNEVPPSTVMVRCALGVSLALTSQKKVYCWGSRTNLLGTNTKKAFSIPTMVQGLENIVQIAASGALSSEGYVFWWGGFGSQSSITPKRIEGHLLLQNVKIVKISCTQTEVLFLTKIGDVYSWKNADPEPKLIQSIQSQIIKDIASGTSHSLFLTEEGKVYAYGRGEFGQLGCGQQFILEEPQLIHALDTEFVLKIACGRSSSLVLTKSGKIFSFGNYCNSLSAPVPLDKPEIPKNVKTNPTKTILENCTIQEFSAWGVKDVSFEFNIIACNESHAKQSSGGDLFRVLFRESGIKAHVCDNQDGTYLVKMLPNFEGPTEISISLTNSKDDVQPPILLKTKIFPKNSTLLDLKDLGITQLKPSFIASLSNLMILDVSSNKLKKLTKHLALLKCLQALIAKENEIIDIDNEIGKMKSLRKLILSKNPIEKQLNPILQYDIEKVKSYISANEKNDVSWDVFGLLFLACTHKIGTLNISPLFSITPELRLKSINNIHKVLLKGKIIPIKENSIQFSKLYLDFNLHDKVCPIHQTVEDLLTITNNGNSVNVTIGVLQEQKSHYIKFSETQFKIPKGDIYQIKIYLYLHYSTSQKISNLIKIDVDGAVYLIGFEISGELYHIISYDEIAQLVKEGQCIAKSICPVYKINWRGVPISVKSLQDLLTAPAEAELHKRLSHPSIVQFIGSTPLVGYDNIYVLMEYMERGSLSDVLHNSQELLPWALRLEMVSDIARAVNYLHLSNISHRDLKTANLLVNSHWQVKLADFGEAKQTAQPVVREHVGTREYMAPELFIGKESNPKKLDCYSFGIILCEIFTRQIPYNGERLNEIEIINGKRPTISEQTFIDGNLEQMYTLITQCWDGDPNKRPDFFEITTKIDSMNLDEIKPLKSSLSVLNSQKLIETKSNQYGNIDPNPNPNLNPTDPNSISASPNIDNVNQVEELPLSPSSYTVNHFAIRLKRKGRVVKIKIPETMDQLLEKASNSFKEKIEVILNSESEEIGDIDLLTPEETYYPLTKEDLQTTT